MCQFVAAAASSSGDKMHLEIQAEKSSQVQALECIEEQDHKCRSHEYTRGRQLARRCRGVRCGQELSANSQSAPTPSPSHSQRKNPGDWHKKYYWWYCGPNCGRDCCGTMPDVCRTGAQRTPNLQMHHPIQDTASQPER